MEPAVARRVCVSQQAWLGAAEWARRQALLSPGGKPGTPRAASERRRVPRPLHPAAMSPR
jgi:hypothetical protein